MIFNNLFSALAGVLEIAFQLYIWVVIARALMSWFNPNPDNQIVRLVIDVTDPPLRLIQRFVPQIGGLDLSPVILIFALLFIQRFVVSTLYNLAAL